MRDAIKRAHRNFLKELVYLLYSENRMVDAGRWFKYVRDLYPDSIPGGQSLDEYALQRLTGNVMELSHDRTAAILHGLVRQYYLNLAADDDDRALSFDLFARKLWNLYENKIKGQDVRLGMPPLDQIKRTVLDALLNPTNGLPPEAAARLRTKLEIPRASSSGRK